MKRQSAWLILILLPVVSLAQPPGEWDAYHSTDGSLDLNYYVYTPTTVEPDAPLVICVHGNGPDAWTFFSEEVRLHELAEEHGFYVACPEGDFVRVFGHWTYRWNGVDVVTFATTILDEIAASPDYDVDWTRVYAIGNSAGGVVAQVIGYELSHRIAAICVSSCGIPTTVTAQNPPQFPIGVMHSHNVNDAIVPYQYAAYADWVWQFGLGCSTYEVNPLYNIVPRVSRKLSVNHRSGLEIVFFSLHFNGSNGENHEWPHQIPQGLDLNGEMWRFFQEYVRESAAGEQELVNPVGRDLPSATVSLLSAHPNPFNATTAVSLTLSEPADVDVAVYDVTGRMVARLANGTLSAGDHTFPFEASRLSSGLYFVRASVPGLADQVRKLVLVR
ncbi:MAG: hypothetical protein MAG453_00170 [Calditrichaeota bacterium]|nr:hypothetical protein [Calditrichota bacterium]